MKNKEYMSLKKMIEYINKALKYTEGCSFETFSRNEEKVDATVFAISQIGELWRYKFKFNLGYYNRWYNTVKDGFGKNIKRGLK